MKHIFLLLFLAGIITITKADAPLHIDVEVEALKGDSIWFGHTFGRKSKPEIKVTKSANGKFEIRSKESYPNGIYAIFYKLTEADKNYQQINFIVDERDKNVSFMFNAMNSLNSLVFQNSEQNTAYAEYNRFMTTLYFELTPLVEKERAMLDESSFIELMTKEQQVAAIKSKYSSENEKNLLGQYLRLIDDKPYGLEGTWEEKKLARHQHYLNHFLDNVNTDSELFWSSPLSIDFLDFITFRVSDPDPVDARKFADAVLDKLKSNKEGYDYYLNYMFNSYERMSQFRFDEVYVSLVEDYIVNDQVDFLSSEKKLAHIEKAKNIKRLVVGEFAEDLTLYTKDNTEVKLSDLGKPFKMLMFWSPDCSHCKRELPLLKGMAKEMAASGIEMAAMCVMPTSKLQSCWSLTDKLKLPEEWNILADGKGFSGYRQKYNVISFPLIYILDKNNKILFRKKGEMKDFELKAVFENISKLNH